MDSDRTGPLLNDPYAQQGNPNMPPQNQPIISDEGKVAYGMPICIYFIDEETA